MQLSTPFLIAIVDSIMRGLGRQRRYSITCDFSTDGKKDVRVKAIQGQDPKCVESYLVCLSNGRSPQMTWRCGTHCARP